MSYFTSEHFDLLREWRGQLRDDQNAKQNLAYDELKNAYEVTYDWANRLKARLFPAGRVEIRRRPTSQANSFQSYNWARIYPSKTSPKELAYTVGIDVDAGFVVKIDTVGLGEGGSVRRSYFSLRGDYDNASPIVAMLSEAEGLSKSLDELVDWSINEIHGFACSYDDVCRELSLLGPTDESGEADKSDPLPTGTDIAMMSLNRIYYGPPGTGKTYELTKLLEREYESDLTSSSDSEWRNHFITEKILPLKWWEGVVLALYDLGGSASVTEILEHPFIDAISAWKGRKGNVRQTIWATLQDRTIEESTTVQQKALLSPQLFDKEENSIWRLAGNWREFYSDLLALVTEYHADPAPMTTVRRRYSFVTFHQSYGYEEFVEGLRPVLNDDGDASEVQYEIRPGVFKELCRRAREAPGQRFAMVIDEINRGNISKIFGELITLIEGDKRDPLDGTPAPVEVTLAYSGEKFSVPANIDIIGTMNTADRSLALLDTALRRRFDFIPLLPDTRAEADPADPNSAPLAGLKVKLGSTDIDVRQILERVNERIEALYDRDHCIGHAYFISLKQVPDGEKRFDALAATFRNRIVPLLEEYFFEDWQKIRLVLADNQKFDARLQFIREREGQVQDLDDLFGKNHDLDTYGTKRRYTVSAEAFANPDAYIGIYQTPST